MKYVPLAMRRLILDKGLLSPECYIPMQIELPQFFEDSDEGFVTFDLAFLQRVGRAELVAGAPATLEFEIESGKAGYIVESGNNLSFRWGPGRSNLKLARQRQMMVELAARVIRGNPGLKVYIIHYDANGQRLRESTLRHTRDRFHGSLTLPKDVASYMLAIRLTGRGIVTFGEFRTFLDSSERISGGRGALAIAASSPARRIQRTRLVSRLANTITKLERRHLVKGIELARTGAGRLLSNAAALASAARSSGKSRDEPKVASGALGNSPRRELRKLNDDLSLRGKSDTAAWLTDALNFAISVGCHETAERLVQYALAIWPQIDAPRRKSMLPPMVETLAASGRNAIARALLESNATATLGDDRLTTYAKLLGAECIRDRKGFVLPSGKLDAYSLSRQNNADTIMSLYRSNRRLFATSAQNSLLMCNAELGKSESLYRRYLNRCLADFNVGHATAVTFGDNILDNIAFRTARPNRGGPGVSVIIAAYEVADTIGYAVRSILQQDHRNIELLICDDASSDGTLAAIKRAVGDDKRVRIFRSDSTQGSHNVRNALLAHAQGEYIVLHHAGAYALPSRIRMQLGALTTLKARAVVAREFCVRPSGEFIFFPNQLASRMSPDAILVTKETMLRQESAGNSRFNSTLELMNRVRNEDGDGAIHEMKHPLQLSLWDARPTLHESEGMEDRYRTPVSQRLSEIAARRRLLGESATPESELVDALRAAGNVPDPSTVVMIERS